MTVKLEPESLGKVQVVLSREGAGITAHFRVETPQAQQALLAEAPLLRESLESKGVPLVQVSVDVDGDRRARQGSWTDKKGSRRPAPRQGGRVEELASFGSAQQSRGIDTRV